MRENKENVIYERITATVKFYSRDRGYGFLKRPNKPDVFFSAQSLENSKIPYVKEGDVLEFDLAPVKGKGGKAINIKRMIK